MKLLEWPTNERGLFLQQRQWCEEDAVKTKESRSTGWICCVSGRVTESCSGLPTFPEYPWQDGTPLHIMWTVLVTKIESLWLSRPTHLSQEHPTGKLCLPSVSRETGENLKQNTSLGGLDVWPLQVHMEAGMHTRSVFRFGCDCCIWHFQGFCIHRSHLQN